MTRGDAVQVLATALLLLTFVHDVPGQAKVIVAGVQAHLERVVSDFCAPVAPEAETPAPTITLH